MNYSFDLHIHSCLSPYGADEMTPGNIIDMCALTGYDIVALTDYNSCGNSAAFQAAAEEKGLLAVPGMELCLREDAHVICLFPSLEQAFAFEKVVRAKLPDLENDPDVFGSQLLVDANGQVVGSDSAFLVGSCDIGAYEIVPLVEQYGGVVFPAHLDADSFSVLSNLGLWDPDMGFPLVEVSSACPENFFDTVPGLSGVRHITGCNAHTLYQIPPHHQMADLPEKTAQAVIDWLKG